MDCTEAFPAAKAAKRSFFLYYLYAVLRAANEVKEFRFRTDKNGQVVYHDQVDIISPIAVPGKTFYTVRIPYHADFERFYAEAYHIVHNIPEEGDPYGAEKVITEQGDFDIIQLSATPQLYFTSLTYTQMAPDHPLDYPLMNAGKVVPREGRLVMHIGRFECFRFEVILIIDVNDADDFMSATTGNLFYLFAHLSVTDQCYFHCFLTYIQNNSRKDKIFITFAAHINVLLTWNIFSTTCGSINYFP